VVGLALVGGLIFTAIVTAVITYRPASNDDPRGPSSWRRAMPAAAILYAGNVTLTATRQAGVELGGIMLMIVGFVGLIKNRNRNARTSG
jgi:hypothetical protein